MGAATAIWLGVRSPGDGSWSRIRREGIIRIGYAVEAPYVFLDGQGNPTGAEFDVAGRIAGRMGIPRIEWIQTDFSSLIADLEEGHFDAIVAGMFITPERGRRVIFSEPTFRVSQAFLVRAGNPRGLHAYEDAVRNREVRIAVLSGSIEEEAIRRLGVPEARIVVVPDALTGRVAVESDLAEGLALSVPTVRFMARRQMLGLTEVADPFEQPIALGRFAGFGGVAFGKTDRRLCREWNRALGGFVGSADHRGILALYGLGDEILPGNVTTAEILSGDSE
ncbi:MAG: transporter substrate-binding domain-containing protein [Candidatus Aminicenantales bacterium]